MSIIKLEPRQSDVGGVPLARALPNKSIKTIGAWCFLDHAGPTTFKSDEAGLQVGRHPHTNLQTFTWMIEGEILHKDSLGTEQVISANKVNLMTAGTGPSTGISHTEQSVFDERSAKDEHRLNMVQLWIALPTKQKIEPSFDHYPSLPSWEEGDVEFTLTTGKYISNNGSEYQAPTKQYSKLIGLDLYFRSNSDVNLMLEPECEYGILVVEGEVDFQGKNYKQNDLIYLEGCIDNEQSKIRVNAEKGTRLMFIGGEPLENKVLLWWNFVADSTEEIKKSIDDWNAHHSRFGDVDASLKRLEAPPLPDGFMSKYDNDAKNAIQDN